MSIAVAKHGDKYKKEIKQIFFDLGYQPQGKIFLKPNLSGRAPLIPGENTSWQFISGVVEALLDFKEVTEIVVGHGSLLSVAGKTYLFADIVKGAGFDKLEKLPKVKLVNFDNQPRIIREVGNYKFSLPQILEEADAYLNIVALKTHMESVVSLSIKNQMGLLIPKQRAEFHHDDLHRGLAYLAKAVQPTLSLVDGTIMMEGNGPHHGRARHGKLIFAGDDLVELDSFICQMIGLDYKQVGHIMTAEQIGVGGFVAKDVVEKYEKDKFKIKPAEKFIKIGRGLYVWPTFACSRCITALSEGGKKNFRNLQTAPKMLRRAFLTKRKTHLIIGRADSLNLPKNDRIICIGSCTKNCALKHGVDCLDKCPPSIEEVFDFIEKS